MEKIELDDTLLKYNLKCIDFQKIDTGYINQTFKVETNEGPFVVQRINPEVFLYSDRIVHNENMLREFLHSNQINNFLVPIRQTVDGDNFLVNDGIVWRVTLFMDKLYSPLVIESVFTAFSLGKKIREFHNLTSLVDVSIFEEIIPNFHNLNFRYEQYRTAFLAADNIRKQSVLELIKQIDDFSWLIEEYNQMIQPNHTTKILCHNDTKISNTLTDTATGEVRYLIDLDTIMPGYSFNDIGDAVRAGCSRSDESETDVGKVIFDHDLFDAILDGYLADEQKNDLKQKRGHLEQGALIMLYMQALRFLTDYLNGNVYYQVKYEEQNAIRARNQLILLNQLNDYLKTNH